MYSSQHNRYSTVQLIGSLTFSSDKMNNTSGEHAYILSCDRAVRIRSYDCDATDRELSARTWWPAGVLDRYLKGHCQIQAGASGLWPWQARTHQLALSDAPPRRRRPLYIISVVQWRLIACTEAPAGRPADLHECESCICCK